MDLTLPETLIPNSLSGTIIGSVCPVCLMRLPAKRIIRENEIYLQKTCPEHGFFESVIWRGNIDTVTNLPERISAYPENPQTEIKQGCPYDCGLCPDHRQQPCCVLLEVTQRCDLGCPVCYAAANKNISRTTDCDPSLADIEIWYQTLLSAGGPFNIQLSGGEPCLRDDLPDIIALGRKSGFAFIQVNTNGLRISRDLKFLEALKIAGLSTVYLQFDGTSDDIYLSIRGKKVLSQKIAAIRNCEKLNIGVVLVPTIKPGINDHDIGNILRFALEHHPVVRGVHFQPISYLGRYPTEPLNSDRITLPEIITALENQTDGLVKQNSFNPSGGPNRYCSFNGNFVVLTDGTLKPIIKREKDLSCSEPQNAAKERIKAQSFVARNWVAPLAQEKAADETVNPQLGGWDSFLSRAKTHLFAISGMAFQDAWTMDLERLHDCYIMVVSPDNRLIPFCAYNMTSQSGESVYRKNLIP